MPTLLPRLGAAMAVAFLLSGCALTDGLTLGEEAAVRPTVLQEAGRTGGGVDGGGGAGGGGAGGAGHDDGGRAGNTKTIGKPKIDGPTLGVSPPGPCVGGSCPSDGGLPAVQRGVDNPDFVDDPDIKEPGSAAGADLEPGDDVGLKEVDPVDGGKVAGPPEPHLDTPGDLGGAVKPGDDVGIIVIDGKVAGPCRRTLATSSAGDASDGDLVGK